MPLFERFHVEDQLRKALDRKVWLPSGGSLIIEHTEALTVIDVNTGKNVGKSNLEETVFHNNMEAAVEIAKQLRLRDIGGIIVIDFIDMENEGNKKRVFNELRQHLKRDRARHKVFQVSGLGLVEMSRQRVRPSLLSQLPDAPGSSTGPGRPIRRLACTPSARKSSTPSATAARRYPRHTARPKPGRRPASTSTLQVGGSARPVPIATPRANSTATGTNGRTAITARP